MQDFPSNASYIVAGYFFNNHKYSILLTRVSLKQRKGRQHYKSVLISIFAADPCSTGAHSRAALCLLFIYLHSACMVPQNPAKLSSPTDSLSH